MSDQNIVTELRVSGHLMKLDTGIYCVFHAANGHGPNPVTGLPGVRISVPPGASEGDGGVEISGFRDDGWVSTGHDAALIRVSDGPAQVLVTVYQSSLGGDPLPQLQVVRLGDIRPNGAHAPADAGPRMVAGPGDRPAIGPRPVGLAAAVPGLPAGTAPPAAPAHVGNAMVGEVPADAGELGVTAHIQRRGDVPGELGEWVGERGSKLWVEGFSLLPPEGMRAEDLEYQAVLGRGWLSPWSQGGQFCGSRRMALPVLGLRVRLRGQALGAFECAYSATFTDGSMVGPVAAGEACESDNLAPLEAFQVILRPRRAAEQAPSAATRAETKMPGASGAAPRVPMGAPAREGQRPGRAEAGKRGENPRGRAAGKPTGKPGVKVVSRVR